MESATRWITDAEARAVAAERQRDEAEAKAAILEDRVNKVERIIQEQQDAIEEMHQAWLAAKGGGGGGFGFGGQDSMVHVADMSGSPTSHQAFILRAEQAEGRADALERKVEQLISQVEERDQQLRMFSNTASQVVSQTQRITELESMCFDREQKIAKLQVIAASAEAAKAEKQIVETEKKTLLKRAVDAENKSLEIEKSAKQKTAEITSALEIEKEALRRHMTEEFQKEYFAINEKFEREYATIRQRVAQAELDARAATHKASAQAQERDAAMRRLEEAETSQKLKHSDAETGRAPDHRLKKLSNHELQALQQRLNAAEARAGAAESRRRECEQEAQEALREKAHAVEALEAARVAKEGQLAEASRRVASLAQLQAERDVLRERLASQKRSFERELEDVRAEMKLCEDALAMTGNSVSQQQARQGLDHSRRSTGAMGGCPSMAAGVGRSPSMSPLRVRPQTGVAISAGSSTPPGSSRFDAQPAVAPMTPMSINHRSRRISAPSSGTVMAVGPSASAPVCQPAPMQGVGRVVSPTSVNTPSPVVTTIVPKSMMA